MEDKEFNDAIDNYHDLLQPEIKKLDQDTLICECFCVSVRDIQVCLNSNNMPSVNTEFLSEILGIGKSCGACVKNAIDWISKV